MDFLELIIGAVSDDEDPAAVAGIAVSVLLLLLAALVACLVLKDMNVKFYKKKNLLFKILSVAVASFRTFLFCYLLKVLMANFVIFGSQTNGPLYSVAFVCSILGLVVFLGMVYFSAQLLNLTVPNNLIPWTETSPTPQIIEAIFKFLLVIGQQFIANEVVFFIIAALLVIALAYKIIQRMLRGYMTNRTVYRTAIAFDFLILHLATMLLCTKLFSDTSYFYFVLLLLPVTFVAIYVILGKVQERQLLLLADNQDMSVEAKVMGYLHGLQLLSNQGQESQNKQLNQMELLHYYQCEDFVRQKQRRIKKRLQKKEYQQIREEDEQEHQEQEDVNKHHTSPCDIKLNVTEERKEEEYTEQLEFSVQKLAATTTFFAIPSTDQTITNSTVLDIAKKKASLDKNNAHKKDRETLDSAFERGIDSKKILPLSQLNLREDSTNISKTDIPFKTTIKHFFTDHLIGDTIRDFRLKAIKIYYTQKVANNPHLAHFLLFDSMNTGRKEGFVSRMQRLVNLMYLDEIITDNIEEQENKCQIFLQSLLEMNQLMAKFDQQMEHLSEKILEFWQNLANNRDTQNIFEKGIQITQELEEMKKTYNQIDQNETVQEVKVHSQMAAFNKAVLFKESEYLREMVKAKTTIRIRNMMLLSQDKEKSFEKGLLMAKLHLTQPMTVQFVNQAASDIIGCDGKEIIGLPVNNIMPQLIAENHQRFVNEFMAKGKARILNDKRALYIKNKQGYVVPVYIYISVNHLKRHHMMAIIEPNVDFQPFEDVSLLNSTPFLLTDKQLHVLEISQAFGQTFGIDLMRLGDYQNSLGHSLKLYDLLTFHDQAYFDQNIESLECLEIEVSFNYEDIISNSDSEKSQLCQQQLWTLKQSFVMKLEKYHFIEGKVQLWMMAFKRTGRLSFDSDSDSLTLQKETSKRSVNLISNKSCSEVFYLKDQRQNQNSEESIDINSYSSISSTQDMSANKYHELTSQVGNNATPKTLKFIINLVIFISLVMIVASIITLNLTLDNISDSMQGVNVSSISTTRFNVITEVRIFFRQLMNIANGDVPNEGSFVEDRTILYQEMLILGFEKLRTAQNDIRLSTFPGDEHLTSFPMQYADENQNLFNKTYRIQQALTHYVNTGSDLVERSQSQGISYIQSDHPFLSLGNNLNRQVSVAERALYFMIANSIAELYQSVSEFSVEYVAWKEEGINSSVSQTTTTCYVCIALIIICGIIIVPLFGRVQGRILHLVKLLFSIEMKVKKEMINCIVDFQLQLKGSSSTFANSKRNHTKELLAETNGDQTNDGQRQSQPKQLKLNVGSTTEKVNQTKQKQMGPGSPQEEEYKDTLEERHGKYHQKNSKPHQMHQLQKKYLKKEYGTEEDGDEAADNYSRVEKTMKLEKIKEAHQSVSGIHQFQGYINKRKFSQAVILAVLTLVLASYFLIISLLGQENLTQMNYSMDTFEVTLKRKACSLNILFSLIETYSRSESISIDGKGNIIDVWDATCREIEQQYNEQVRVAKHPFLEEAQEFIEAIETGKLCETVFDDTPQPITNTTTADCKVLLDGIAAQGFTSLIFQILQTGQQHALSYKQALERDTVDKDFYLKALNHKLPELLDLIVKVLDQTQRLLKDKSHQSISNYFQMQSTIFILIFSLFMSLQLITLLVFGFRVFRKLKREMLLSNKLLYIVDFENVRDEERDGIMQFLKNY